ncbi:MAG: Ig-like domain-containing protein [Eubacterium sp.]|nr:Ig-like domain-containing protein [Eubacterium sp.]
MSILSKRKAVVVLLIFSIILSMLPCKDLAAKKKKKMKFNKTKITMKVGEDKYLKLKNYTIQKPVRWSTSNKKVVYFDSKSEQDYCRLTAKKAGTARITAKIGKVKLRCKVTVKKSRNTARNGNKSSVSIPSSTPAMDLIVTPAPLSEPSVKDNWNTLLYYILTQGHTADDGSKKINMKIENFDYLINYYAAEQLYRFSCIQEVNGSTPTIEILRMEIRDNNLTKARLTYELVFKSSVLYGGYTVATASIPATNKDTLLPWIVFKDNIGGAQITDMANKSFKAGYLGWDILLMGTVGNNLTMEKLGFLPSPN